MKYFYILLTFAITIVANVSNAQTTCQVDQILSQADIDQFPQNHPECTVVSGRLMITGIEEITNLDGLSQLTEVTGALDIGGTELVNLHGLHNIKSVGGFAIQWDELQSLQGLDALENVNGDVYLNGATEIESLDGLQNLTNIGGALRITNCKKLENITGLDNLQSIGSSFTISQCDSLTSLQGFTYPLVLNNTLEVLRCPNLTDLSGLEMLSGDILYLNIIGNDLIQSLAGIEGLIPSRDVIINGNEKLTSLVGISLRDSLHGDLEIRNSDLITDLSGLENPVYIDDLTISGNINLTSLNGLTNTRTIDQLYINGNDKLENLLGLDSLELIGLLRVEHHDELTSLHGLENTDTIYQVRLDSNDKLVNLQGLNSVKAILQGISLISNEGLQSVDGLDSLTFVKSIGLTGNDGLKNLDGFRNVTAMDGPFYIQRHDSLVDISGLANIDPTTINEETGNVSSFDITIRVNPMLSECHIASVCNKYGLPEATIRIEENGENCLSVEEVIDQCNTITGLKGYIYIDVNEDGEYDSGDSPILNCKVSITLPDGSQVSDITDNDGYYRIISDAGTYPITYEIGSICYTPSAIDSTITVLDSIVTLHDFSLDAERQYEPPTLDQKLDVMMSRAATRCGFTVRHFVSIQNNTCLDLTANLDYYADDLVDSIFNISVDFEQLDDHSFKIEVPQLLVPGQTFDFFFDAIMPGVDQIGNTISDSIAVTYISPGTSDFMAENYEVFNSEINCAYDPNDKLATPDRSDAVSYTHLTLPTTPYV